MVAITGVVVTPQGIVKPNARLYLTPAAPYPFGYDSEVVLPDTVFIKANAVGAVSFTILPGNYKCVAEINSGFSEFGFYVDDVVSATFQDCMELGSVYIPPQVVQDVFDARDDAEASAASVDLGALDDAVTSSGASATAAAGSAVAAANSAVSSAASAVDSAASAVTATNGALASVAYATRAALIAATVPVGVNRVTVLGIGPYDRNDAAINPAATSNGGTYKWVPSGVVDPIYWGAACDGVTDDTTPLRSTILYAESQLNKTIHLGSEVNAPGIFHSEGISAIFVGSGRLVNSYRKSRGNIALRINPKVEPANFWNTRGLNATASPVVCLVGDSISTYWANVRTRAGIFSTAIETAFMNQFPSSTFHNRAIGGQRLSHFDGKPTTFPEWYTDTGRDWMDYVEDLTPDCVVIAFGMNDAFNFSTAALSNVIDKLNAFVMPPTVILCTPLNPSLNGKVGFAGSDSVTEQEGKDLAAGVLRTYALRNNIPLWDFNRLHTMVRDGFDPVIGAVGDMVTGLSPSTLPDGQSGVIGTRQVYNTSVEVSINEANLTGANYLNFYYGKDGYSSYVTVRNSGGFLRFTTRWGTDQNNILDDVVTTHAIGSTTKTLYLERYGNVLTIYRRDVADGANTAALFTKKVIVSGGLFYPKVTCGSGTNVISSATMYYDRPTPTVVQATDADLWGDDDESFGQFGGSGFNHPGTWMCPLVYSPIIDATKLNDESLRAVPGSELVVNGTFATDTAWQKGTGWAISGGVATFTPGVGDALFQTGLVSSGLRYRLTFSATVSAGSVLPRVGGSTNVATISSTGNYSYDVTAEAVNDRLVFSASSTFSGSIDNVSLRPLV